MKHPRQLLASAALMAAATAGAADYGYLAVRQADGTVTTLAADGLRITFADGKLVATQGGQTSTLSLASLDAMYFTTEGATTSITAISSASSSLTVAAGSVRVAAEQGAQVALYALNGVRVASLTASGQGEETLAEGLQKGVYIVNIGGQATKIVVK